MCVWRGQSFGLLSIVKGIEANLDKINAIVLMKPPGVQERGTETHRQNRSLGFIAKLAE
jgi:hypothetical protein